MGAGNFPRKKKGGAGSPVATAFASSRCTVRSHWHPGYVPSPTDPNVDREPVFHSLPWVGALLDVRTQDRADIPDLAPDTVLTWVLPVNALDGYARREDETLGRVTGPYWTLSAHTVRHDGTAKSRGTDCYLLITAPDGTTSGVLADRDTGERWSPKLMAATVPALTSFCYGTVPNAEPPTGLTLAWALVAVIDLHAALTDPASYLTDRSGRALWGPDLTYCLRQLPKFAAAGARNINEAFVLNKRNHGMSHWSFAWWPSYEGLTLDEARTWYWLGLSVRDAMTVRRHMSPARAQEYLDRAPIDDVNALLACAAAGWSPRTVTGMYRLVQATHGHLDPSSLDGSQQ